MSCNDLVSKDLAGFYRARVVGVPGKSLTVETQVFEVGDTTTCFSVRSYYRGRKSFATLVEALAYYNGLP